MKTAVPNGKYKLIASPGNNELRLFDLSNDPGEKNELGIEEQESVVSQLRQHIPDDKATGAGVDLEITESTKETFANLG